MAYVLNWCLERSLQYLNEEPRVMREHSVWNRTVPKADFQALERQYRWAAVLRLRASVFLNMWARKLSAFSGAEGENLHHKQGMGAHASNPGRGGRDR